MNFDKKKLPEHVTVNLRHLIKQGGVQTMMRLESDDKNNVDKAAVALGMRQSDFTRMVVVQAAESVLKQLETGVFDKPVEQPQITPHTPPGATDDFR